MGDLSAHFSRWEFRDHSDGTLIDPPPELLAVLERLRAIGGVPLTIVSGYRSARHNAAVGGARRSQHLLGRAADLNRGLFSVEQARAAGAIGIGHCAGWVTHVDVRTGRKAVFLDC